MSISARTSLGSYIGIIQETVPLDDLWCFDFSVKTWEKIAIAGGSPTPPARGHAVSSFASCTPVLLLLPSISAVSAVLFALMQTFIHTLTTIASQSPSLLSCRCSHTIANSNHTTSSDITIAVFIYYILYIILYYLYIIYIFSSS